MVDIVESASLFIMYHYVIPGRAQFQSHVHTLGISILIIILYNNMYLYIVIKFTFRLLGVISPCIKIWPYTPGSAKQSCYDSGRTAPWDM